MYKEKNVSNCLFYYFIIIIIIIIIIITLLCLYISTYFSILGAEEVIQFR